MRGWRGSHRHRFQLGRNGGAHDDVIDEHSTLIAGLVSFLPSVVEGGKHDIAIAHFARCSVGALLLLPKVGFLKAADVRWRPTFLGRPISPVFADAILDVAFADLHGRLKC
ncbi:hypothetical protein D9M70_440560 [compost metagenome]